MPGVVRRFHLVVSILVTLSLLLSSCSGATTDVPPTPTSIAALDGAGVAFSAAPPETTPTLIPTYTPAPALALALPSFEREPVAMSSPVPPTQTTAPEPTSDPPGADPTAVATASSPTPEVPPTVTEPPAVEEALTPEVEATAEDGDIALVAPTVITDVAVPSITSVAVPSITSVAVPSITPTATVVETPAVAIEPTVEPTVEITSPATVEAAGTPTIAVTGTTESPALDIRSPAVIITETETATVTATATATVTETVEPPLDLTPAVEITPTVVLTPAIEPLQTPLPQVTAANVLTGDLAIEPQATVTATATAVMLETPTVALTATSETTSSLEITQTQEGIAIEITAAGQITTSVAVGAGATPPVTPTTALTATEAVTSAPVSDVAAGEPVTETADAETSAEALRNQITAAIEEERSQTGTETPAAVLTGTAPLSPTATLSPALPATPASAEEDPGTEVIISIELQPRRNREAGDAPAATATPVPTATETAPAEEESEEKQGNLEQTSGFAGSMIGGKAPSMLLASTTQGQGVERALRRANLLAQTGDDLPPVFVTSRPADGESWPGGPVAFVFDRPLAPHSVEGLRVEPELAGDVAVAAERLIFTPGEQPEPGVRYRFVLDEEVRSAAGVSLNGRLEITLVGLVPLAVSSTQPGAGGASEEILPDTPVVVVFNKPVVPLAGIDEQSDLPDPLAIEPRPPGEGTGRWLNTSVYTFVPAQGWAGATEYTVVVDGVTAQDGSTLAEPVRFSFTTALPAVVGVTPAGASVAPDTGVSVVFNQAMDRESTEAAFSLVPMLAGGNRGEAVAGRFEWSEPGDQFVFTPTTQLEFGQSYQVQISTEAQAASRQGRLRQPFVQDFTVVTVPMVTGTRPESGATGVSPESGIVVNFSGNISNTTVLPNVSVAPAVTATTVYSFFSPYSNELTLNWFMRPHTTYTVTLGVGIADIYGNTLAEAHPGGVQFSFTTGDYAPLVRLDLPNFTHFSAYTRTVVPLLHRNMDQLDVALYQLPESEFLRLAGTNSWEVWQRYQVPDPEQHAIWRRTYEPDVARNETFRQPVPLVDAGGNNLPPGLYLLEAKLPPSRDENADTHARAVIVLSNDNLVIKKSFQGESLVWQTDLRTGEPVADASIRFFEEGDLKGDATTGADGLAASALSLNEEQPWFSLIAISGMPGDEHFAVAATSWQEGIAPWQFDIQSSYTVDRLRSAFYTDRPLYRPGQTVYWKGIVRAIGADDMYRLPPAGMPVHIIVRDDRGTVVVDREYTLNEHGTVNGEVTLAGDAPTGYYSLEARIGDETQPPVYGAASFQVAEYRAPDFEIAVVSDRSEYVQGDTIEVAVQATYFSGGPLADAPVTWRLLAEPYLFTWSEQPKGRAFSFEPADLEDTLANPYATFSYGLIQEGRGATGGDGRFVIELPADLAEATRSQTWTFDVTVQSPNNQFVSGRTSVPVHRSNLYAGISPQAYLGSAGEPMTFDLVTLTADEQPYPDADLTVVVYDYRWNSVYEQSAEGGYRWETSVEKTPVYTEAITTNGDGVGQLRWTPETGGNYFVTASGEDTRGNPTSSGVFVWVQAAAAETFVPWRRENNDRLDLVADKDLYQPGDTAEVLVPSPFTGPVYALITLERSGILERSVRVLESNSEVLAIPITAAHIPNIYVSVVLVKGVDETNPIPALRVGYVQLPVDAAEKELAIEIEPSVAQARPGQSVTYTLTVRDNRGEGVAGAELSAALIDKAVLSLAANNDQALVDRFYYRQPLGVTMGALLVINQDRLSQQLSEGGKGGGGGGGPGALTLRQNFADVAYWRADLETGAGGVVTFSVTLPDNLTTWQLIARAVSDETRVGDAASDLVSTKEVLIRPILPRFFTAGDRAQIGAVVQNNSEVDLEGATLTVEVAGGSTQGVPEVAGDIDVAAGDTAEQSWTLQVDDDASQIVVTYTVDPPAALRNLQLADAVRISLPVHRYETPETVGTAGTVPVAGRLEAIRVPEAATGNGDLTVRVEPSLAAGMVAGLDYLAHFPYECVEQTVSRFLPNLFTATALTELGIERPGLQADLDEQLEIGLQRLVNRQNPDGGWGWWAGMQSNRFITSYVLWGLWTAQAAGYAVPENTVANALAFIDTLWMAPSEVDENWMLNEMAFAHFVLSEMGEGDPGRIVTLYDERARLDIYGQAFLAMALANTVEDDGAQRPRVQSLLDSIAGQAIRTATGAHWQEADTDWWTMNTDIRTTAIVLDAFTRLRPDDPLLPNVVRWLMVARQDGRWASTQETAWSIIALTDWMVASGELEAGYEWRVALNSAPLAQGVVTPRTLDEPVTLRVAVADLLRDEANALSLSRNNDNGNLYYTVHMRTFLDATAVPARDRGLVVSRALHMAEGERRGEAISTAQVGDVVSVTVTLQAPADVHYLVMEVPLPAGTEPIDTSLATESQAYGGPEFGMVEQGGVDGAQNRYGWGTWLPSKTDIRDEKVALFADYLPAGTYEYTFLVRASLPGEYRILPAHAEEMYFPEVWGRSSGGLFTVTE